MRTRVVFAAAVVTAAVTGIALLVAMNGRRERPAAAQPPSTAWDAARWQPGEVLADIPLVALDGRTVAGMLDRGANRPLILILAASGSPALDRCASRWRELFEIYKDRVEFLAVFMGTPGAADSAAAGALRRRVDEAMRFAQCNNWRIPVLVDGPDDAARAVFGDAPHAALLLDEKRQRLGTPVVADVHGDLDAVSAWLRHRYEP